MSKWESLCIERRNFLEVITDYMKQQESPIHLPFCKNSGEREACEITPWGSEQQDPNYGELWVCRTNKFEEGKKGVGTLIRQHKRRVDQSPRLEITRILIKTYLEKRVSWTNLKSN